MKNFSTWMIVVFMFMFWVFRVIVAVMSSMNREFVIQSSNITVEIILLFVVLICACLIIKRKIIGAILYLISYGYYFGSEAFSNLYSIMNGTVSVNNTIGALVSIIGIILPIAVLLDMLADKARIANPKDKKTDWFYKNENFDREFDERADRNNYKF